MPSRTAADTEASIFRLAHGASQKQKDRDGSSSFPPNEGWGTPEARREEKGKEWSGLLGALLSYRLSKGIDYSALLVESQV